MALALAQYQVGEDAGGQDAHGSLYDDQRSAAPRAGRDATQGTPDAGYGVADHRDGRLFQLEAGKLQVAAVRR